MATSSGDSVEASKGKGAAKAPTQEQIVAGFQELRNQQRKIIAKMSEIDMERKEHELVIEALKDVDTSRKCFRMVGDVLVERTVGTVLPAITANHEQLTKLTESLSQQLEAKGKDLQDYREKHNIRVRGEEERTPAAKDTSSKAGVLVGQS
jgi:prefoldin subunit 2